MNSSETPDRETLLSELEDAISRTDPHVKMRVQGNIIEIDNWQKLFAAQVQGVVFHVVTQLRGLGLQVRYLGKDDDEYDQTGHIT